MPKRKSFSGMKPELQNQAEAVEDFLNVSPAGAVSAIPEPEKEAITEQEKPASPVVARKPKEQKRSKRLQLLITESEYDYLSAVAWENHRSVNDYMNMLIENDMKKNQNAKGGK